MKNKDFTFLTKKQLADNKIDIIKKRGTKAAITDFSILLGGYANYGWHIGNDPSLEGWVCSYWTKTSDGVGGTHIVSLNGDISCNCVNSRTIGARLVLPFSSNIPTNKMGIGPKIAKDGILEVEYGYYPQQAVSKSLQKRLERAYKDGNIKETGNKYTIDSRKHNEYDELFSKRELEEFEFEEHRYVRIEANFGKKKYTLSNGENYDYGDIVWVEVSPIKWLVDEKEKIMLSDKILFAGVQFKHTNDYDGNFEETDIKRFMDNYFSKEITAGISYEIEGDENRIISVLEKENEKLKQELEQKKQNYERYKNAVEEHERLKKEIADVNSKIANLESNLTAEETKHNEVKNDRHK